MARVELRELEVRDQPIDLGLYLAQGLEQRCFARLQCDHAGFESGFTGVRSATCHHACQGDPSPFHGAHLMEHIGPCVPYALGTSR